MYERTREELAGKCFFDVVYQEERRSVEKTFWDNLLAVPGYGISTFERTNVTNSGKRINVRYFINFTRTSEGKITGVLCCVDDITGLKRALDELKNSLREKELLLKEVHHRVKNNLQIIISLFRLKSREIHDPHLEAIFDSTAGRIRAIANLHNRIYLSRDVAHVDSETFIESSVKQALSAFHFSDDQFNSVYDLQPVQLPVDIALPLSLIINELVSNSVIHGSTGKELLTLTITFKRVSTPSKDDNAAYILCVSNTGKGFPDQFNLDDIQSFGLTLVTTLVSQLGGTVVLNKHPYTEFIITFTCKE
jgi:PAS domain S-box-containing protein